MVGPVQISAGVPAPQTGERDNTRVASILENTREQAQEQLQQVHDDSTSELPAESHLTGYNFRVIDNPRLIQARVIDRETQEVLREVPSTPYIRFARAFRTNLADLLGRQVDLQG